MNLGRMANSWKEMDHQERMLRFVQPSLIGLIDGVVASIAPILGAAYVAGAHAAFIVGMAAAFGAAISMGISEGMSDDGNLTGRGTGLARGIVTGSATFLGGIVHVLPFLINDLNTALTVAYIVIGLELIGIAWIRQRFMDIPLWRSLIQVTLGGVIVATVGILLGHT